MVTNCQKAVRLSWEVLCDSRAIPDVCCTDHQRGFAAKMADGAGHSLTVSHKSRRL